MIKDCMCKYCQSERKAKPGWPTSSFKRGDRVKKRKGASWQGKVVGWYSTELTKVGYAVESEKETGSVQIYPEEALELVR